MAYDSTVLRNDIRSVDIGCNDTDIYTHYQKHFFKTINLIP